MNFYLIIIVVCSLTILIGLFMIVRNSRKIEKLLPHDKQDECFVRIQDIMKSCRDPFQLEICDNLINQFKDKYKEAANFDVLILRYFYKEKKDKMILEEACELLPSDEFGYDNSDSK